MKARSTSFYKECLLSKVINWYTVIDVIHNSSGIMAVCQCRCGTIFSKRASVILKHPPISCGCFRYSDEYKQSRSDWYKNNSDKVSLMVKHRSETLLKNPDIQKTINEKNRLAWTDDRRKAQSEATKERYKNNQELAKKLADFHRNNYELSAKVSRGLIKYYEDNEEARLNLSVKNKKWRKDNPDKVKEMIEKRRNSLLKNPDIQKLITDKYKLWCLEHKQELEERGRRFSQWCKDNPDKCKEWGSKYSDWYKNNPEAVDSMQRNKLAFYKDKRIKSNLDELLKIIKQDYIDSLISGNLRSTDTIETLCPLCGTYAYHKLSDVFVFSTCNLKSKLPRLCNNCSTSYYASSYEQEIADYISKFYYGELVRNSRNVISPLELDLYYPEKNIAIEFNGDYWHNENHRQKDYHYNKFKICLDKDILLISIFESEWNSRKEEIKQYIQDTFSEKVNSLSFIATSHIMNNNYPVRNYLHCLGDYIEDSYVYNNTNVYTCGHSTILDTIG